MKLLPTPSKAPGFNTEEEMNYSYAGMVSCNLADVVKDGWIIDSGASDHMSGCLSMFKNATKVSKEQKINLPTGETIVISLTGDAKLSNEMQLKNVLYIPTFKHNLLSVQKLTSNGGCKVNFHPEFCIIEEEKSGKVLGVGKAEHGLYYLIDRPLDDIVKSYQGKNDECRKMETWKKKKKGVKVMNAENEVEIP